MKIDVRNLSIGYGNSIIQSSLNFTISDGELVAILGANGCGKSTLLRTLAGLQPALGGSYSPEADEKTSALVLTERLSVESTTVHDVVAMGRYPYTSFLGTLTEHDERIVSDAMEQVGVGQMADTYYNAHSDGEKQRVLIAKALAQQTPIILLDEPTAHLDLPGRVQTLRLLSELTRTQGKTILISTHELDLAMRYADRILLMMSQKGAMIETPENLCGTTILNEAFGMDVLSLLGKK